MSISTLNHIFLHLPFIVLFLHKFSIVSLLLLSLVALPASQQSNHAVLYIIRGTTDPRMYAQMSNETAFRLWKNKTQGHQPQILTAVCARVRIASSLCVILVMMCCCCFSFLPIDAAGASFCTLRNTENKCKTFTEHSLLPSEEESSHASPFIISTLHVLWNKQLCRWQKRNKKE